MSQAAAPIRTILVGVDGSAGARRALTWAAARSREGGAELVGVHVLTYNREFALDASPATIFNWRRDLEKDLAGPWSEPARSAGVEVRTLLVEDDSAAAGILATAQREQADLVVLGAHGRGNLAERILGATTYTVTHRAATPVVIIPPDWSPPEG